jgi:AbrB family looped-hinge helix DNA binding protein
MGFNMPTAILDERGRVVLPKELADELGVSKGDMIVFEKRGKDFVLARAASKKERLDEMMDWNPERTGKPERVSPKSMKGIWKT